MNSSDGTSGSDNPEVNFWDLLAGIGNRLGLRQCRDVRSRGWVRVMVVVLTVP